MRAAASVLAFAIVVVLGFDNGGFFPRSWTIAAVVMLWAGAMALLFRSEVAVGRRAALWVGLLAAFVAWTAFSLAWSVERGAALDEIRRGLVYVAAAAALSLLTCSASDLVVAVWGAAGVVIVYALARYLLEPGFRDDAQGELLARPVGYANALAMLAGMAILLALGLALRAGALRLVAAASIAPFAAAIALTGSRATILAVALGAVVLALSDRRSLPLLAAVAPIAAVEAGIADHSGLSRGDTGGGGILALSIVVGALALACAPRLADRVGSIRVPAAAIAAAAGAAAVGFAVVWGTTFFGTGYRPVYWHVAWREYVAHPLLGSGAGTFGGYWLRYGEPGLAGGALDAHNLYLQTLAEVGPVGLGLLVAALALPVMVRRADPLAGAALAAYLALLAHAALDWDWQMPVLFVAGLTCAAAVLAPSDGPQLRLAGAARTCALALVVALAAFALAAGSI